MVNKITYVDHVTVIPASNLNEMQDCIEANETASTSAKTEVEDIRTGADGTTYSTAGDAVRGQVGDLIESTNVNFGKLFSYDASFLSKRYSKQLNCILKPAVVLTDKEVYRENNRAVYPLDETTFDGDVCIFSDNTYSFGVYKRIKSTNAYDGYLKQLGNNGIYSFTPDANYLYFIVYANTSDDVNFTQEQIEVLNNTTKVYTGKILSDDDILPLNFETNLIKPSDISIGGYFYGQQNVTPNTAMAYTDYISVKENRTYYFPFITLGYSWFDSKKLVLGGAYHNEENFSNNGSYKKLVAPKGACYIRVSTRSGDVPNMLLSEIPNSKATVEKASYLPVVKSAIKRESINWIHNVPFNQNFTPSRLYASPNSSVWTYNNEYANGGATCAIYSFNTITMDKSKICMIFSVPSGVTPNFVFGYNGHYSGLSIADGGLAVLFNGGQTAEIRMGTGEGGNYQTLLKTVDISSLDITNGGLFAVSIEKDSINKQIINIYNAMAPADIITETFEATQDPTDENVYRGQIRCWGACFLRIISGSLNVYRMQMYSTAPSYPKIAIWGDSYVENAGRNPACGYGYLLKQRLDGNVFLSGRGGATSQQAYKRILTEINTCSPQFIIYNLGVNDSFGVAVDTYKSTIQDLIDLAKEKSAEPILITTPRVHTSSNDNLNWITEVNPWIRSLGYRYIDVAYALSTGDGLNADTTKFMADLTHPNLLGGSAIFKYIETFLPDLLWK